MEKKGASHRSNALKKSYHLFCFLFLFFSLFKLDVGAATFASIGFGFLKLELPLGDNDKYVF